MRTRLSWGWSAVLLLGGCSDPWQAEPLDRVCTDVGYAIAAVAFACSSSEVEAQAAYAAFEEGYACRIVEIHGEDAINPDLSSGMYTWANEAPMEVYYTCPVAVGAIDCDAYAAYAADDFAGMDDWLGEAAACATILAHADGTRLPTEEP